METSRHYAMLSTFSFHDDVNEITPPPSSHEQLSLKGATFPPGLSLLNKKVYCICAGFWLLLTFCLINKHCVLRQEFSLWNYSQHTLYCEQLSRADVAKAYSYLMDCNFSLAQFIGLAQNGTQLSNISSHILYIICLLCVPFREIETLLLHRT